MNVIFCPKCPSLYEAVDGHPDMQLNFPNPNTIVIHKEMEKNFIKKIKKLNMDIHFSENTLVRNYPNDIILNCFNIGDLFVHKIKNTDRSILNLVKNKKLINVKQGYTKCSTAIINNTAVITNDIGIAKTLLDESIDVLHLPYGDIILKGLDYGFIGGTCGLIDEYNIAFFGNLKKYKYGKEIIDFLKKYKVEPHFLSDGKLVDRGTLFVKDTINILP